MKTLPLSDRSAAPSKPSALTSADGFMASLRLDATTSEPYYQQLRRQIQNGIATGELPAGSNLPSERVLADLLQISRTTVKHCYNDLRKDQLLSTHGRGGTQVQAHSDAPDLAGKLKSFADEMQEQGRVASTQLVSREVLQDRVIASIFGQPSASSFLKLEWRHLADGEPLACEIAWYDLALAPDMGLWDTQGSAFAHLRSTCGVSLSSAVQTIEAVTSSKLETHAFDFSIPGPCLLIKRKTYSGDRKLVEYVESTYRGDTYAHRSHLTP